jgi:hypothetical protein
MAERYEPVNPLPGDDRGPARSAKDTAFRSHLLVYVVTGLFLLSLNVLTSFGDWWFYWPLFFWGWAVVLHAVTTYGTAAPARVMEILRSFVPGTATESQPPAARVTNTPPSAVSIDTVEKRVQRLWRIARQLPDGPVRDQAFRVCAAADRVAEVMAADRIDAQTVAWFDDRLLAPAESLLSGYLRLSSRGIESADTTLRRIEEQNLPQIETRLDALYDQLHRGDVIDLTVASEMLDLQLEEAPRPSLRSRT